MNNPQGAALLDGETREGRNPQFHSFVADLKDKFDFDFVSIGIAPIAGAPLKWLYCAGASSGRVKRIVLAPGRGIGGIVLKSGKPMLMTDIDTQLDPREYSSYPIVFAEDLRSFCALPLITNGHVCGVLLTAFRTVHENSTAIYQQLVKHLNGTVLGMQVIDSDFLSFDYLYGESKKRDSQYTLTNSDLSLTI